MKKTFRTFLCLMLSVLLCAALFAGCGESADSGSSSASLTGDVLTINGETVNPDLVTYLSYVIGVQALSSNADFLDSDENIASLKNAILEQIKSYMLPILMAKEKNISLSEEEEAQVAEQVKMLIEMLGNDEAYDNALATLHMTRALQEDVIRTQLLQEKMLKEAYGADIRNNIYRAKHILLKYDSIPTDDDGNPTMTEEEWRADRLKLAEEISKRATDGEDFDALIEEYNEDSGMAANPDGYYFIEGQMQPAFYEGTKALEIGGISAPVEVSDYYKGFHIIQRLEPEAAVVEEQLADLAASSEKAQADANALYNAMEVKEGADFDTIVKQQAEAAKADKEAANAASSSSAVSSSAPQADSSSGEDASTADSSSSEAA